MGYYLIAALALAAPVVFEPTRAMSVLLGAIAAVMTLLFIHARRDRQSQPSLLDQAPRAASQEGWDPPFDDLMRR
jgi:membrane associated rhomboid family serine protease